MLTIIKHLLGSKPRIAAWIVLCSSLAFTQYMIPNFTIINDVEAARGGARGGAHVGGRRHHATPQRTVRHTTRRSHHRYEHHHHRRGLAIGLLVASLPTYCTVTYVGSVSYHTCDGVYYRPRYEGSTVVYVVVEQP